MPLACQLASSRSQPAGLRTCRHNSLHRTVQKARPHRGGAGLPPALVKNAFALVDNDRVSHITGHVQAGSPHVEQGIDAEYHAVSGVAAESSITGRSTDSNTIIDMVISSLARRSCRPLSGYGNHKRQLLVEIRVPTRGKADEHDADDEIDGSAVHIYLSPHRHGEGGNGARHRPYCLRTRAW